MPDYRTLFDKEFLYAFHLGGREVTVEIVRVRGGEVTGTGGKKNKKPLVYFRGKEKPLALNSTNAKTIASMYGNNTDDWIGKRVTLYPTTTNFGGETVDCIRIRPGAPRASAKSESFDEHRPAPQREPGDDGDEPPPDVELPQ